MNLEELEAHLIELKSKQMNTRGVLRKLLQIHCRNHNVERALQIKKVKFCLPWIILSAEFYFTCQNTKNERLQSSIFAMKSMR